MLHGSIKGAIRAINLVVNLYVLLKCLQSKQLRTVLHQPTSVVIKSNCILHICGVNAGKCCISGGASCE